MIKFSTPLIRTIAMTAFVSSLSFGLPAFAQSSDTSDTPPAAMDQNATNSDSSMSTTTTTTTMKSKSMDHGKHGEMHVEERIKTLHDKLMITPAQEDAWSKVAQSMRDTEATIEPLIQSRHENATTMTALDDLKSYQQITQAHADGVQKMLTAFEPVYNDFSDAQKKNADMIFSQFEGHGGMHKHMHGMKHTS